MGLRDFLKKKDDLSEGGTSNSGVVGRLATGPEFTFVRTTTNMREVIHPPSIGDFNSSQSENLSAEAGSSKAQRKSLDVFGQSSRDRSTSDVSSMSDTSPEKRRLKHRLRLSRRPSTSDKVPASLPEIRLAAEADDPEAELQWEQRATILVEQNEKHRSGPANPGIQAPANPGVVSSKKTDADIQEAIRLHESGQLEESTRLFGILADPTGANNPLSQVLYGLALRHGWGCEPDPGRAVTYLTKAASNAAVVENMAILAGQKKGGAAKGELILALFELANCFRHGWGIPKDAVAAKHYYETAANLGDTDAMNEVAFCYLEGIGCKKDKFAAARYYRLAEKKGNKTIGNSWIWKEKYDPNGGGKKK